MKPASGKKTLSRLVSCTLRPATGVSTASERSVGMTTAFTALITRRVSHHHVQPQRHPRRCAQGLLPLDARRSSPTSCACKRRRRRSISSRPKRSTCARLHHRPSSTPRRKATAGSRSTRRREPDRIVRGLGMEDIRRRGPLRAHGFRRRLLGRVALRAVGNERSGAPSGQGGLPRPLHRASSCR